MVGRRHAATAFRPSMPAAVSRAPSRGQTFAMLVGVLVVAAGITVASFAVKPDKARSFDLFYGSVFVDDNLSPVAIDLSSGKATVRLSDAPSAVSAIRSEDLDMVPLTGGTLMLDPITGEFNMLDASGFVLKPTGGGVRLPQLPGSQTQLTTAVPAGDSAYLVRSSTSGTAVYLVGQSTVASAVGVTTGVKARAQATLKQTTADDPGLMTSANGALFLLTGPVGAPRQLVQLSVPPGSNAGAPLAVSGRGSVTGVAALSSATVNADGTGGDAVGIASLNSIRVLTPDGASRTVAVHPQAGVDAILPVGDAQGALVFLYHAADSWNVVRAPITGGTSASVSRIDGISPGVGLITPVESGGKIYTLGRDSYGSLFQIADDGTATPIEGAAHYPLVNRERLNLDGAEVTAVGSRVIFDSRANLRAVVVFSDGSSAPRIVDKHSAVQVNTNGAAAITGLQNKQHAAAPGKKPKPQPHPEQAINNKINCKIVSQTPHIPSVELVQRASRSVQLEWQYPLLDPQDCDPSTYTVTVRLLSSDAPPPPATVTVQGQDGVNLTGLFPDTKYEIVVTAYINRLHTASAPLVVSTSVEGPAAPTNLHTTVDDKGNWTITWNSCGGIRSGCVPTADWQIIPHLCDGVGLSNTPDTRRTVGDPTQHSFSYTYQGSESLLGRGLSFDIQGIGEKGTIGDSANDGSCSYSWTPTVPSDISLKASAPPVADTGGSTTQSTVSVQFANGQAHDLGGLGGEMTYELLQGDTVVSRVGPTTRPTAVLPGIEPGRQYQATVIVNPPRHRDVTAQIPPVDIHPAIANWPTIAISAGFSDDTAYTGTLNVDLSFPSSANNRGETFDLTDNSGLTCGNTAMQLSRNDITAGTLHFPGISRFDYHGRCSVRVWLSQDDATATDPPLYGDGTTSKAATAGISIDVPTLHTQGSDFSANWVSDDPGHPQIAVAYTGGDAQVLAHADNWHYVLADSSTSNCGASGGSPPQIVDVDKDCVKDGEPFTAIVSFSFYGQPGNYTVDVNGSGPTPVSAADLSFSASWVHGGLLGLGPWQIVVDMQEANNYGQPDISALHWTMTVDSSSNTAPGTACGTSHTPPNANESPGPAINVRFGQCPKTNADGTPATYTVTISYSDPNYGTTGNWPDVPISGAP